MPLGVHQRFFWSLGTFFISLHIHSMWETTVMHKQVSGWTVNFGPNSPVYPFLELKTRKPPPPFWKTSDLGWPKFTPKYPPPTFWKTSDLGWPKFTPKYPPHFGKLQIWDDQSLLRNTPPPFWKTSDLGWPKFTPKYPPHFGKLQIWDDQSLLRNTPPPHFGKLQIWDDQSLLRNTPPILENFRFGMTKVYSEIPPPILENFRFGMTKVYSEIPPPHFGKLQIWDDQSLLRNNPPPHFGKLQIWDDQSLLRNTPPFWKTSDLGWPKFTPKYPPNRKLSESLSLRFSEYRELLHMETLSNPDNY